MLNFFKRLFTPPIFADDEDKTRVARYLNALLWMALILFIALLLVRIPTASDFADETGITLSVLVGVMAALLFVMRRGYINAASILLVSATWIVLAFQAYSVSGVRDTAFIGLIVVILLSGLLLEYRFVIVFTALTIGAAWLFAYFETAGTIQVFPDRAYGMAQDLTVILIMIGLASYFTVRGLNTTLERARASAADLAVSNTELNALRLGLEKRVEDRTAELAAVSRQMTRRAAQLQAVSDVARAIASVQEIEALLPEIAQSISRSFGVYHVGIFLNDDQNQFAVLRAANSEGGQRMLSRSHQLEIGRTGIVGNVAATGRARVALDTGADSVFFNNPDLPETHSEIALPLKVGEQVIGVLDVQSRETNAFTPDDADVLGTLANQVAIAIQNAASFSQMRAALAEAETAFQSYVAEGWDVFSHQQAARGYAIKNGRVTPLQRELASNANRDALSAGRVAIEPGQQPTLAVPIKVRGATIGVLNVRGATASRTWNSDELTTAQTIADRVAIALENARLAEETRERAARDRAVSEMSNRIGASVDMDNILTTAVRELGRLVPDSDVVIQLGFREEE